MGYGPEFRKGIQDRQVWGVILAQFDQAAEKLPLVDDILSQMCTFAKVMASRVADDRRTAKIASKITGDLILLFQGCSPDSELLVRDFVSEFQTRNNRQIPAEVEETLDDYDDVPASKAADDIIKRLKDLISEMTSDVDLLETQSNYSELNLHFVEGFQREIRTGQKYEGLEYEGHKTLRAKVDEYIIKLREKLASDKESASTTPVQGATPSTGYNDSYVHSGKRETYASATNRRDVDSDDSSTEPVRWGDYTSSDEEGDDFTSMLESFGRTGVSGKPVMEIPKDFENRFPKVYKAWRKLADKWQWDVKLSDCDFQSEGFIGGDFGKATDSERTEILSKLKDQERLALNTLVSFLLSVLHRPESIATGEQASLVSGYVTSLFLKENYKKDESSLNLLRLSLKGADAGESVIRTRLFACFKTGSKCANVLFNTVNKMLRKIITRCSSEEIKSVISHSDLCFTSPQGVMYNCFRTVSKKTILIEETTDKRGKTKKTRRSVVRPGKDRPNLNAKDLELTQSEYELVQAKENSFNRLDEVVNETLSKFEESTDPLKTAKVCKYIVDVAYGKIAAIRSLNRERKNAIRSRAQELAGEGKSLTSADWLKAKKELISSFEEISKDTLSSLDWDIDKISKGVVLK
jgi:hypothetical protein